MALFDNGLKIGTPTLLGMGVLILAPVLTPLCCLNCNASGESNDQNWTHPD